MATISVVGTTSWGTLLAVLVARNGHNVCLWSRTEEEAQQLRNAGENTRFLPGTHFPRGMTVLASVDEAFGDAGLVIIAVPSQTLRANIRRISGSVPDSAVMVSATKGLEIDSGMRMSQIIREEMRTSPQPAICALSGPNLAREIVQGKPSTTVVSSLDTSAAQMAQDIITSDRFRVYTNTDIVGVEFGGALKNIIAIGAGICDGLGLGENAKAAFMTRGLAEIARLAVAAGADPLTLTGLAGMGDLIATCSSSLSRNRYVGEQLSKGKSLDEIRSGAKNTAEGVGTTPAALKLARELDVEMPIASATNNILSNIMTIEQAISDFLGRTPRPE